MTEFCYQIVELYGTLEENDKIFLSKTELYKVYLWNYLQINFSRD